MKILADYWFIDMRGGTMGIVVGEDECTGERKAYIGVGAGYNQETDRHFISEYGQKLPISFIEELLNYLKSKKKGGRKV